MAYNEFFADRIDQVLKEKGAIYEPRKMMGGLCYMVDDKMCLGIVRDELMARINPNLYESSLKMQGCKEMNFTGRAMKGFVFVDPDGTDTDEQLAYWIQLCLDFNPLAQKSPKKKPNKK
jgi:TfoX/Sxy family transcriptional regulator of competence genes